MEAHPDSVLQIKLPEGSLTGLEKRVLTLGSIAERVKLAGAGDMPFGTLRGFVTISAVEYAVVRLWMGVVKVFQGEAITPNAFIKVGASGAVVTAGVGDFILGRKLSADAGAVNDEIEIHAFYMTAFNPAAAMVGATASSDGTTGSVPAPLIADQFHYLRGDGTWAAGTNGPLTALTRSFSMPGHTFVAKDPIRMDSGGNWVTSRADDADNAEKAEVFHLVSSVVGDTVNVVTVGEVTGWSGLTVGDVYYVGLTGGITNDPVGDGCKILKPVFLAESATSGTVIHMRGDKI